jgi:RimJ/RimL family protein N-acetyltransferase
MSAPSDTPAVQLRPAAASDAYALWLWANDAESRRASAGRDEIAWAPHVAWLDACLHSPAHLVLIATLPSGQPAGVVRFDTRDDWRTARLSYAVAPEARGSGLAVPIVALGAAALRAQHPGVSIQAEVEPDNRRSLSVFRRNGWLESDAATATARITFWYR